MSILIRGMEMPDSCINCPFSNSINFGVVCLPSRVVIPDSKLFNDIGEPLDRQPWCPLVEVPPHGDLIDRKNLIYDLQRRWTVSEDQDFCYEEVWLALDEAPTIIEAEEGD